MQKSLPAGQVKIGRKIGYIVHCQKCLTEYCRSKEMLGGIEQCGVCGDKVPKIFKQGNAPKTNEAKK